MVCLLYVPEKHIIFLFVPRLAVSTRCRVGRFVSTGGGVIAIGAIFVILAVISLCI